MSRPPPHSTNTKLALPPVVDGSPPDLCRSSNPGSAKVQIPPDLCRSCPRLASRISTPSRSTGLCHTVHSPAPSGSYTSVTPDFQGLFCGEEVLCLVTGYVGLRGCSSTLEKHQALKNCPDVQEIQTILLDHLRGVDKDLSVSKEKRA